jgi:hypothetical protein
MIGKGKKAHLEALRESWALYKLYSDHPYGSGPSQTMLAQAKLKTLNGNQPLPPSQNQGFFKAAE